MDIFVVLHLQNCPSFLYFTTHNFIPCRVYQSIFGFNALYNRFYLDPHITGEISGSRLKYNYRGQRLTIGLDTNLYSVSNNQFTLSSKSNFGFSSIGHTVFYFDKDNAAFSIKAVTNNNKHLTLNIIECNSTSMIWEQNSPDNPGRITYTVSNLKPASFYSIYGDNTLLKKSKSDAKGRLFFDQSGSAVRLKIVLSGS